MELDELKNRWSELDKQLQTNKVLNETIILKMAQGKVEKWINRILIGDIIGTIVLILVIPFMVYYFEIQSEKMKLFLNLTMGIFGIICFFLIFWQIYKISILMKIDLSKEINSNIYYVNKYRIQMNREFFGTIYFFTPVFFILGILTYAEANVPFSLWIFLICAFLSAAFILWYSKRKHKKTYESILASLDEIKELKEE